MKIAIKVLNPKHNRVTQELLFEHGYEWNVSGKNFVDFKSSKARNFTANCHIEVRPNKNLMYAVNEDLHRYADTFMNLKELKEHLNENCN
jgi:hypothetical protein